MTDMAAAAPQLQISRGFTPYGGAPVTCNNLYLRIAKHDEV
jgi:hypothetical protein